MPDLRQMGKEHGISAASRYAPRFKKQTGRNGMSEQPELAVSPIATHIAMFLHIAYEEEARKFGWQTQEKTRKLWNDLPVENRNTMLSTAEYLVAQLCRDGWIPPKKAEPSEVGEL